MSSPRLLLERMMHRQSIAVPGDSLASYALLKLIPTGEGGPGLPLTLVLCIDISGSMYWSDGAGKSRLDRVREASTAAVSKLKPTDRVALIAFANGAEVVLPVTPAAEAATIAATLDRIDCFNVDQAGTTMNEGLRKAIDVLKSPDEAGRLHQVVVLTDGETSGEGECRELAGLAAEQKVSFSVMGVGTEWNTALIKDMAARSNGRWYYIDADQSEEAMRVFLAEFDRLADAGLVNVRLEVRPMKDIKLKRVRQVAPQIQELPLTPGDKLLIAQLGTLEQSTPSKYILDLSLPKRPDGKYVVAQVEVKYELGDGQVHSTGPIPLEMAYTAVAHGYVNAEVARHIDEVQIFELNNNLQTAIITEKVDDIRKVAQQISRKSTVLGPRGARKTMLAEQILQELDGAGKVSRKTMLAVDDAVRSTDEPVSAVRRILMTRGDVDDAVRSTDEPVGG
ncbi:vWA domain-containing protein [Zavarzinella formosa]|uniref:vWA domain-containing protein n=1 Tax=Zavarzinella formosa TaxID=360055 RepID=UPI00030E5CE8|nr:VWA domain-containing protein [Zavarzinella formosa]